MSIAFGRRAFALLALVSLAPCANAQFVSYTGTPLPPENFSALASTGTTGTTLPNGWFFTENNVAGVTYTVSDGGGATPSGDAYSFGTIGSGERAFGGIASGSITPKIGVRIQNDTGATLDSLDVSYTGEQWRLGDLNGADKLDFQYCTSSCAVTDAPTAANWTNVDALDFSSPTTTGTASTALDGNAAANRTAKSGTLSGLGLAAGSQVWIRWNDTNDAGVDDGLAIDDVQFGPAGDFPPTVASTTPGNGATGVGIAANVVVNFSEPVSANGAWYTISCGTSSTHAAIVTGGPTSWTLDPTTDFAFGETCTVTIVAAQIVDLDAPPDAMGANYVFSFTTGADTAPVVASTVPAAGAGAVATTANIVVNFSEPVTTSGSWFSISCTASSSHAAVATGGPTSYTLNPDTDFQNSESCTVTILAAGVTDQDGTPDNMAVDYPFTFGTAATAGDYYAGIDASNPAALRLGLHNRIKDHVAFTYFGAWTVLEAADQDPANSGRILDVYRNRTYTKVDCRSGASSSCPAGASNRYNREHTWPNSHGFNDLSGLDGNGNPYSPYTDTHMLYLSAEDYNSTRGNSPYGNCPSGCAEGVTDVNGGFGGGSGVYPGNSNWSSSSIYETWNHRKGDMARAVLYMDVRYEGGNAANGQPEPDLIVTDNAGLIGTTPSGQVPAQGYMGLKSVLVAWSNSDPPDDAERLRNDVIYSFQQNRNPFIDHPEWVNCLFATPAVCNGAPPDALFSNGFE